MEPLFGELAPRFGGRLYAVLHSVGNVAAADHEIKRPDRLPGPEPAIRREAYGRKRPHRLGHGMVYLVGRHLPSTKLPFQSVVQVRDKDKTKLPGIQQLYAQQTDQ